MTVWLEGRAAAINVTARAVIDSTGIVNPGAAYEGSGSMTGAAIQICRKVGGIGLGRLANRGNTVMTGLAIVHDAGMIEHRADEAKRESGGMTDTAILVCWYMAD